MAVDTYANLKVEIKNHLDRDDLSDGEVDTLIDLAEARHKRDVRIRDMVSRSSLTVDSRYEDLPSDFLELHTLRLLTDPVTVLEEVSRYQMTRIRDETNGKPTRFAVYGSEIEFDKNPDSSYSGEIIYTKEITALSDSNTSNAILSRAPDLYLYGALLAAEPFLGNDPRIQTWSQLYAAARDAVNRVDRQRSGPLYSRIASGIV